MESWPEFVTESEAITLPRGQHDLTGWETVVFELQDELAEAVDVILRRADAEGSQAP
jgi:hypothetical protein